MNRKFYACSVGKPGEDYVEENLQRIISNKAFVLHTDTIQKGKYELIKPGDILLLKYERKFVAYGESTEKFVSNDPGWNHWVKVIEWYFNNPDNHTSGIVRDGIDSNTIAGGKYGTVKEITLDFALNKLEQIDNKTNLFKKIMGEINMLNDNSNLQELIALLKFKKQIILQGPPGTGKTYMADLIAREMTKPNTAVNAMEAIEAFFKNYDDRAPANADRTRQRIDLLNSFYIKFPKEKLSELTLEDYAIGTGENDSFCWWIERGLKNLGSYSPGSSRAYLIYWSKDQFDYSTHFKHSQELSELEKTEDAMKYLANTISGLINETDNETAYRLFGDSFLLKLLHTYHPDKYFPVNSPKYLDKILNLFGVNPSKLNFIQKNQKVQDLFIQNKQKFGTNPSNVDFMHFLFDNLNLKGKEDILPETPVGKGKFKFIQFHPAYSYEDFVRGITAKATDGGQIAYKVQNKTLASFAQDALDNPNANHILVIDEINRANLPAVLGELIYALEYRYDPENPAKTTVESMYAIGSEEPENDYDIAEGKALRLPKNLYIIGTMNTADRSVGHIDYAIRRRFAFVDVQPSRQVIQEVVKDPVVRELAITLFDKVEKLFLPVQTSADESEASYLALDFRPEDVQIGHSYFLAETKQELEMKLYYEIKPILKEYLKDGVLLSDAEIIIEKLHV
jgi:5-methylcytosine-specific restriction enzyme B